MSSAQPESESNPWPHLETMFQFKSVAGQIVKLTCLLCSPKVKECSASLSSLSNLRKQHVQVGWSTWLFYYYITVLMLATGNK